METKRVGDELIIIQRGKILMVLQFFVKGFVYQDYETGPDPISDRHLPWLGDDVILFKELDINTNQICL